MNGKSHEDMAMRQSSFARSFWTGTENVDDESTRKDDKRRGEESCDFSQNHDKYMILAPMPKDSFRTSFATLGKTSNQSSSSLGSFNDEAVTEQYCMMAQHEAHQRVREHIINCEKRQRIKKKPQGAKVTRTKFRLPTMIPKSRFHSKSFKVTANNTPEVNNELPMLPLLPKWHNDVDDLWELIEGRNPELCPGVVFDENHDVERKGRNYYDLQYIIVRCHGCHRKLKVKQSATLMGCPKCNNVCPAIPF